MTDANPAWSPDGKRLAFNSNGDIFVIASDGSGLIQLTNDPSWEGLPSWSPNGSQIAFNSERGGTPDIYTSSTPMARV
jgi:TolB protein